MKTVAALFVDPKGVYSNQPGVDVWGPDRDARKYEGPHPVVAHPPCNLWVNFAALNFKRWGGEHNRPGADGGCFASALHAVRRYGGVLEHPASSNAWGEFSLQRPVRGAWRRSVNEWVCEVWQSAYGHAARKRTWLLYSSQADIAPPDMVWDRAPGTHQVGRFDVIKPVISGRRASATPPAFRDALLALARGVG